MDILRRLLNKIRSIDSKKRYYILALIGVIGIMAWAFITAGIITCNFNRAQLKGSENEQKVDALGLIITETKEGKKYFEIYGEKGDYSNEESLAVLHNVVGNFYKDNKVAMSFQSSKGSYNEDTGVITLYENTYIVLEDSTSLSTDKLTWSGSNNDTIADGHVVIKRGKEMQAVADKCIISAGYDKFKIIGKTQTKLFSDKEK